jgi:hypothetical protein
MFHERIMIIQVLLLTHMFQLSVLDLPDILDMLALESIPFSTGFTKFDL